VSYCDVHCSLIRTHPSSNVKSDLNKNSTLHFFLKLVTSSAVFLFDYILRNVMLQAKTRKPLPGPGPLGKLFDRALHHTSSLTQKTLRCPVFIEGDWPLCCPLFSSAVLCTTYDTSCHASPISLNSVVL
jgi:hypothetical protein